MAGDVPQAGAGAAYAPGVTEDPAGAPTLTLTASLRSAVLDARRGVVRLHPEVLAALDLATGDPVLLRSELRTSAGIAAPSEPGQARGLLLADDLTMGNLRVRDGAQVDVCAAPIHAARTITVAGEPTMVAAISPEMLRLALLSKVVTSGDEVSLLPQDLAPSHPHRPLIDTARRSLANTVGSGWTAALLTVVSAEPDTAALVTPDTVVAWAAGSGGGVWADRPAAPVRAAAAQATGRGQGRNARSNAASSAGEAPPPTVVRGTAYEKAYSETTGDLLIEPGSNPDDAPRPVEDLVGLRSQAAHLTELFDLAFHHREVLSRLGTSVQLGVLVTGPPGAGKATLVRSVAAATGAEVIRVWCPGIAALAPDAAAHALRSAAAEAAGAETPGVLLLSDAETLAPRTAAGPLATVLAALIAGLVASGKTAVVCTTSRPEDLDASLRRPGVLDHELRISLPDTLERRDLLALFTRSIPLADDVSLDEVAAGAPGFVAADLGTLVREAGVRAAMRQRDAETPQVTKADLAAARQAVRPTSMAESTLEVASVSLDDVGDMVDVKEALTESVLWPLRYPDTFTRLGVEPPRGVLLYGPPGCGKTYLVRALAGTGQANVLAVKGAELLTKWVGESERSVRELFRRAREAAPTLVFLDEVDALAPVRGQATDGGTTDRVVAALLTELDDYSSADCAALIREAALAAMRESIQTAQVTGAHLQTALERVRPSLDPAQVAYLAAYADRRDAR